MHRGFLSIRKISVEILRFRDNAVASRPVLAFKQCPLSFCIATRVHWIRPVARACRSVVNQVSLIKGDFMKRISTLLAACSVTGAALIVVAVATAQRPAEKPQEVVFGGLPGVTQGASEMVVVSQAGDAVR